MSILVYKLSENVNFTSYINGLLYFESYYQTDSLWRLTVSVVDCVMCHSDLSSTLEV